jgi:putative endonuclease
MKLFNWLIGRGITDNLGTRGENLAARHVRRELGMKVLARNVRCPGGELDIVALDGDDLVFVEVRTRRNEEFTTPEATITSHKKRFLTRSAHWYIQRKQLSRWNPRFDIIAIIWPKDGQPTIRHHRNAFSFRPPRRHR